MKRQEVFPVTVRQQSLKRFSKICLSCKLAIMRTQYFTKKIALFKQWLQNHWSFCDSFQKSVKYMTWWQDLKPHHLSSKWRPLLSKLIIQDGPKTDDDTLSWVCHTHFPDNGRAIWSNFAKMERICSKRTGFSAIFWQISSDKICCCCCNWVAKFLIKGGGNFVQIGVSCLRGSPMTIAVLGNNPYYHPAPAKCKI